MREIFQMAGSLSSGIQRSEPAGMSSISNKKPPPWRNCACTCCVVSWCPLDEAATLPAHAARVSSAISCASAFVASRTTIFIIGPCGGLADAHARFGARPRVQDVDARIGLLVGGGRCHDHAFRNAELHLARRQVGHQYRQLADQLFR